MLESYWIEEEEDDAPSTPPRWRKAILWLLGLLMVGILVLSALSPAWNFVPWLLGYWNTNYHLSLTSVSSGQCPQNLRFSQPPLAPSHDLCICGVLNSSGGTADFTITLRDLAGKSLDDHTVRDQHDGNFCHTLTPHTWLEPNWYTVTVTPRWMRNEVARLNFRVQDTRPDV